MDLELHAKQLEQLLQQNIQQPYQKQLQDSIDKFLCIPDSVQILILIIQSSQIAAVSEVASFLLRNKINGHWDSFTQQLQDSMKNSLLALLPEKANSVRHVVTKLAKKLVPERQWDELFQFLIDFVKNENPRLKEAGLMVFESLIEEHRIAISLEEHYTNLLGLFGVTLQDPNNSIRIFSLKVLSGLFPYLNSPEQIDLFVALVPYMIVIVRYSVSQGDNLSANEGFTSFSDLIEAVNFFSFSILQFKTV